MSIAWKRTLDDFNLSEIDWRYLKDPSVTDYILEKLAVPQLSALGRIDFLRYSPFFAEKFSVMP
jgi:hypothetical protein